MKLCKGKIIRVQPKSLAEEIDLKIGDSIIEINGRKLSDIIDLSFELADEEIELLIEHANGEREIIAFDKDIDEELGVEFESAVFDGIHCCKNHCVFCFVDMIAPKMRRTLSIKDDDYRMSFLYGNFITLTNLTDNDYKRIKQFHLSPLFVSIHAMNPKIRAKMLRTPLAEKIVEHLDKLENAGVEYHTQVVLCEGLNDSEELERTISELVKRRPNVLSLAIVPVGITKHRRDKFPLKQFDRTGAIKVIEQVERWQKKLRRETGKTFIYLGDEFYILADREMPPVEFYDDFPQLDNGIGLTRSFISDWENEPITTNEYIKMTNIDVIAGISIAPTLKKLSNEIVHLKNNLNIRVLPVINDFFGDTVNVSGLLTGIDIINTLKSVGGERDGILIPESALRSGENIFLDDITLDEFKKNFPGIKIETVQSGAEFKRALMDFHSYKKLRVEESAYMWQSNAGYTKI
ncbi:MAG: DUF512 domain-containing protein [Selenomonadaceae bacterium]|nr:DUF512 domain-containing protein [Selenomonadaceae bacterium]MBR1730777.1 DUF512 domain-containing protein [Selenomonadaceae bacterium]